MNHTQPTAINEKKPLKSHKLKVIVNKKKKKKYENKGKPENT